MTLTLVWNSSTFEAADDDTALLLLHSSVKGVTHAATIGDRPSLYFDAKTPLLERRISKSLNVRHFIEYLEGLGEIDLISVFLEIEDKADAINSLEDEELLRFGDKSYYFSEQNYEKSLDFLALAVHMDAILFGIASHARWHAENAFVGAYPADDNNFKPIAIYCLNKEEHGRAIEGRLIALQSFDLAHEKFSNCTISTQVSEWFSGLTSENKARILDKLMLAVDRDFDGGEPLFKTLNDADGIREIRFSAFPGGAIRILFKNQQNGRTALLSGFIKKSKSEGYDEQIKLAKKIWSEI